MDRVQYCKIGELITKLNWRKEISPPLMHQKHVAFLADPQNMLESHILLCVTPSTSYFMVEMNILCLKDTAEPRTELDRTTMNSSFPLKKRRKKCCQGGKDLA